MSCALKAIVLLLLAIVVVSSCAGALTLRELFAGPQGPTAAAAARTACNGLLIVGSCNGTAAAGQAQPAAQTQPGVIAAIAALAVGLTAVGLKAFGSRGGY